MGEPHVISALTKKRAELLGEIQHYQQLIKFLKENLSHIDKTILLFDENYNIKSIKPKKPTMNRYFKAGEAKIYILDMLRQSKEPLRTDRISEIIAKQKGLDTEEGFDITNFQKTILASLYNCEHGGLVEKVGKEGTTILWQVKDL